ncbi:MAG: TolC family protein, partial [Pseudomonadota bacterium]
LNASRALYRRVVGRAPGRLRQPREPRAKLPRSLRGAIATGLQNNPTVVQALYLEQAARFNVDEIFGELLPSAQLEASYTSTRDPNAAVNRSTEGIVTGRVTIPLYQGGEPRARLRQAKHTHVSRLQAIEDARTRVREQVVTAWSLLLASRAQLVSGQAQVAANQTALSGVREEERVGQRTLLDVLDAQQALLDSRVTLISTQRDIIVNAYTLLAAMGQFDGATYGVASVVYDPDAHYHEARRKWLSVTITERPPRHGGAKDGDYAHHRPLKLGGAREKTSNARPVDGLKQGSWGGWQTMTSPKPQGAK